MQPTPLTTALPKLAAMIDDERPLISAALLDVVVTDIQDDFILAEVTTEHSYDILTSHAQHEYLNSALSRHWEKPASFSLTRHIPSTPSIQSTPSPKEKRTANTLTFCERATLQNWMNESANTNYVANESDADAARQATKDLALMVKAVAGSEGDCEPAFPGIIITAGNIASMRKILGIEKVKPAKPAPLPVHDIDLVALHAAVQRHEQHFSAISITFESLAEVIAKMWSEIKDLKERITSLEASSD